MNLIVFVIRIVSGKAYGCIPSFGPLDSTYMIDNRPGRPQCQSLRGFITLIETLSQIVYIDFPDDLEAGIAAIRNFNFIWSYSRRTVLTTFASLN